MKEHGATEEEAIVELNNQLHEAWKVIIKACLHPTRIPLLILTRPLRMASTWEALLYKSVDSYTIARLDVEFKGVVTSRSAYRTCSYCISIAIISTLSCTYLMKLCTSQFMWFLF